MAQLYGCTAANGVWVVPGSHKLGKIDIAALEVRMPDLEGDHADGPNITRRGGSGNLHSGLSGVSA